jgi:hypothetical protein
LARLEWIAGRRESQLKVFATRLFKVIALFGDGSASTSPLKKPPFKGGFSVAEAG